MVVNVIDHGFTKDKKNHSVGVRVVCKNDEVILRIKDDCVPFDPAERNHLTEGGDVRKDDDDFIESRADDASEEYEVQLRAGAPPACAQELAMEILMEGLG